MPPGRSVWSVIKIAVGEWFADDAPMHGAALAFYSIFSLAPLLVIVIAVAGAVFGRDAVQGEIVNQFDGLIGREGAKQIQLIIQNANQAESGWLATVLGVATLFLGATAVFTQLKTALNTVWGVRTKTGVVWGMVVARVLSFAMVFGIAFLLLVSLVVSAGLSALAKYLAGRVPGLATLLVVAGFVASLATITLLFAAIFRILPDARIAWGDVWVGAFVTAILFTAGKELIGLYIGTSSVGSVYGAAGSLVVLLLWIYYSAQIFLLGAEFTQAYARTWGSRIRPSSHAELADKHKQDPIPQQESSSR